MDLKLAISALAWLPEEEPAIFEKVKNQGVSFIELIPARCKKRSTQIKDALNRLGITPIAFQSLLFETENLQLFQSAIQREKLFDHLRSICDLAAELNIRALVFGSPKNRQYESLTADQAREIAFEFFLKLGVFAQMQNTSICLETVPKEYECNFLTQTLETADFVRLIDHPGIKLNLDLGAIYVNKEKIEEIWKEVFPLIGHIHWSEPKLVRIRQTGADQATQLLRFMRKASSSWEYDRVISIEMMPDVQGNTTSHIGQAIQSAKSLMRECE
jgi:D-psicose/D-tagatose/L-ribulose 3-epimerase